MDEATAKNMLHRAQQQGLRGAYLLADLGRAQLYCNGIGAAWFPPWLRWAICTLHPSLVPTSWVHDIEYQLGGGIWARWVADWHFLCNGLRGAFHDYPWYRPRRYAAAGCAVWYWLLLRIGGQAAFNWQGGRDGND